jgi:hypothetical protein
MPSFDVFEHHGRAMPRGSASTKRTCRRRSSPTAPYRTDWTPVSSSPTTVPVIELSRGAITASGERRTRASHPAGLSQLLATDHRKDGGVAPTHRVTHGTSSESVSQRVMINAARMMMASVIRAISPRMAVAHRRPWCNEFATELSAVFAIMTRRSVVIARA